MNNANVMPLQNQGGVMQKPKNYFVIALVIAIVATVFDGLSTAIVPLLSAIIEEITYIDYNVRTIISNVMYLFSNIFEYAVVFFGFLLWSKNKILAFRFSGMYFFAVFVVGEFSTLMSSVNYNIFAYHMGNYSVYSVMDVILNIFAYLLVLVIVPLLYNILNKRTSNHTIFLNQKKKVLITAIIGICALQLVSIADLIYLIINVVSRTTVITLMIFNIFSFFFLLIALAVIGLCAYNFRKDGRDIISFCSLIFFPRIITILISGFLSIVANIFMMFVYSNMISVIVNIVNLLISLTVTAVIVYLTIKNFFPIVNNIPAQDNFSSFPQYPINAAQEVTSQGITISQETNTTAATPDVSPFSKTEINETDFGESEPTVKA